MKTIFTFFLILSAMVFAQNTITNNQSGAAVGPSGYVNYIDFEQEGMDNVLNNTQVSASSYTELSGMQSTFFNEATITQTANGYAVAEIYQVYDGNRLTIEQTAGTNANLYADQGFGSAKITQNAATGFANAEIYQTSGSYGLTVNQAAGTDAHLYSDQSSGSANITQKAITGYADAEIYQGGNGGMFNVKQTAGTYTELYVKQFGLSVGFLATQIAGGYATAEIFQAGNGSWFSINQTAGINADIFINQGTMDNDAMITQNAASGSASATFYQGGYKNLLTVNQTAGTDIYLHSNQSCDHLWDGNFNSLNKTDITQNAATYTTAISNQQEYGNRLIIQQTTTNGSTELINEQSGDGYNYFNMTQNGVGDFVINNTQK